MGKFSHPRGGTEGVSKPSTCNFLSSVSSHLLAAGGSKYMLVDKAPCNGPSRSCHRGTPRGRLQRAWRGHHPTDLPPGKRVPRSVQVAQFGLKILEEEI